MQIYTSMPTRLQQRLINIHVTYIFKLQRGRYVVFSFYNRHNTYVILLKPSNRQCNIVYTADPLGHYQYFLRITLQQTSAAGCSGLFPFVLRDACYVLFILYFYDCILYVYCSGIICFAHAASGRTSPNQT